MREYIEIRAAAEVVQQVCCLLFIDLAGSSEYLFQYALKMLKGVGISAGDIRGVGLHATRLESAHLGPAVNPIQKLYSRKGKERQAHTAGVLDLHDIDERVLAEMPPDIQQEIYAAARLGYSSVSSSSKAPPGPSFGSKQTSAGVPNVFIKQSVDLPDEPIELLDDDPILTTQFGSRVDMDVFKNLPEDIQTEIREQHAHAPPAQDLPALTSASQLNSADLIDPQVLAQLPEFIKTELKTLIRMNKSKMPAPTAGGPSPHKIQKRAAPPPSRVSEHSSDDMPLRRSQIDRSVFDALPLEVQRQINADLRVTAGIVAAKAKENAYVYNRLLPLTKPEVKGFSDVKSVIALLDNWMTRPLVEYSTCGSVSPPLHEDVEELKEYLVSMVEELFLSEVCSLVSRGATGVAIFKDGDDRDVFADWINAWDGIEKVVSLRIKEKHGGTIKTVQRKRRVGRS